jgi:hypothetical protein
MYTAYMMLLAHRVYAVYCRVCAVTLRARRSIECPRPSGGHRSVLQLHARGNRTMFALEGAQRCAVLWLALNNGTQIKHKYLDKLNDKIDFKDSRILLRNFCCANC